MNTSTLLEALLAGDVPVVHVSSAGHLSTTYPGPAALVPGSFNPVHSGHWQLLQMAQRQGEPVGLELSICNVDKPPLTRSELERRLQPLQGRTNVWLTAAATFAVKARLFPGTTFVIGVDTAQRILAPRYYVAGAAGLEAALIALRVFGCRFLVAGRLDPLTGAFVELDNLAIPAVHRSLFTAIASQEMRCDISSTQLRQSQASLP